MIGLDYTPGLLAELAKKPNVRILEIPVTPKGQLVSSCTKRYTDDGVCRRRSSTSAMWSWRL